MLERQIIDLIDRWKERRKPRHNPQLALTAHAQALAELQRTKALPQRQNAWRAVRLVLLVVMLLAALVVAWKTFTDVSLSDLTSLPLRDLLRKIFRR
jgi:hypothetical protein